MKKTYNVITTHKAIFTIEGYEDEVQEFIQTHTPEEIVESCAEQGIYIAEEYGEEMFPTSLEPTILLNEGRAYVKSEKELKL